MNHTNAAHLTFTVGIEKAHKARTFFLHGTHTITRWKGRERFVIVDTCFDSGLNFLTTWEAWRADPQRPQQLHYLALANAPYSMVALREWQTAVPGFSALSDEIQERWPLLVEGFHQILLSDPEVSLTLMFGGLEKCMKQVQAQVDTFYLDHASHQQCSPDKPARLFNLYARLAAPQAQLALDVASSFDVNIIKNSGFTFDDTSQGRHATFAPRWHPVPLPIMKANERRSIVIGAGLAGSSACERLCARGWQVSLIERHASPAIEASGNLAGIFMPQLARDDNPGVRLSRAAFLFALRLWQQIGGVGRAFPGEICGVLHLARDAARARTAQEIVERSRLPAEFVQWLNADAISRLPFMSPSSAETNFQSGGWFFPQGGWAHPGELCEALLSACGTRLKRLYGRQAIRLERMANNWHVFDASGALIAQAPHVIIANGRAACHFSQTAGLPLEAIRGQVTYLQACTLPPLPMIVCREGYVTRPYDGVCSIGASYDAHDDPDLRMDSQQANLGRLAQLLPQLPAALENLPLTGRVGFRTVSADRLPLVGALPDQAALVGFRSGRLRDVPRHQGLYGLFGYASRGLTWAPLAAELLAARMSGEPLPLEHDLAATLDPARFCLRAKRRTGLRN